MYPVGKNGNICSHLAEWLVEELKHKQTDSLRFEGVGVFTGGFILGFELNCQPAQPLLTWQSNKHAQQDTLSEKSLRSLRCKYTNWQLPS